MGEKIALFDGSSLTAAETYEKLLAADLLNEEGGNVQIQNSAEDRALLELSMQLLG
jgi:hypothetical protein